MHAIGCFIFIFEASVVVNFVVEIKRLSKVKKFDNIQVVMDRPYLDPHFCTETIYNILKNLNLMAKDRNQSILQ